MVVHPKEVTPWLHHCEKQQPPNPSAPPPPQNLAAFDDEKQPEKVVQAGTVRTSLTIEWMTALFPSKSIEKITSWLGILHEQEFTDMEELADFDDW